MSGFIGPTSTPPEQPSADFGRRQPRRVLRLRAMDYADLLDFSIKLYMRRFLTFMAIWGVIFVPLYAVGAVVQFSLQQTALAGGRGDTAALMQSLPGILAVFVGWLLVVLVAQPIGAAALTRAVSEAYLGRSPTLAGCYRETFRRVWGLMSALLLRGLIIVAIPAVLITAAFALLLAGYREPDPGQAVLAIVLTVFVTLIIALPLIIYLSIVYLFIGQIVMLENVGGYGALRRSAGLVKRYWWKCFVLSLLLGIIMLVLMWAISWPSSLIDYMSRAKGGMSALAMQPSQAALLYQTVAGAVAQIVAEPFAIIALTLLYYDLRIRKEGFDLQVMAQGLGLGTESLKICPSCGANNALDSLYCGNCGSPLEGAAAPRPLT